MKTLLSAKQHRILAANLLKNAGTPGYPNKTRAKQMAKNHEILAKMIDRRAGRPARDGSLGQSGN